MTTFKRVLREWIIPFGIEILVVLLVLKFVFFLTLVPTGSMTPTFGENSWLFVTRTYTPEKSVKRGDIVVFYSDELEEKMVKRVIGLPGEHIELDEFGVLFIDGEKYDEPYVINTSDLSGEWDVPQGCYLFMGDNRASSLDARYWDNPYIPAEKLIGEARFALWPLSNFGPLH